MNQVQKKHLFSLKSLLVMCLLIALFGALNTIERSRYEGVHYRGFPLMFSETATAGLIEKLSDDGGSRTFHLRETRIEGSKSWRSQLEGLARRGKNLDDPDDMTFGLSDGTLAVITWAPLTTFNTLNLILNMAMGIGLSALLALACEREVFRRFRVAPSVKWRPTGER